MRVFIQIALFAFTPFFLIASPATTDDHIKIDQFGYRCNDEKIAVISNPQTGFNAASTFAPGTGTNQYQIRNWSDNAVVFSGTLSAWNTGSTHSQSGDKVWWFDFSGCNTPGTYYVFDVLRNVGSYKFEIREDIYQDVLKHAVRSYYYQRCGTAKSSTYAGVNWTDAACHAGTQQDTDCRLYSNTNVSTSKNLSGGWHDAGDYNKYVNFTWAALTDLLLAYEENPSAFTDDYNIPESANGVPDLLDEAKYELDWLLKMQNTDGSVLSVIGGGSASPPSADHASRFYGPATTSATLSAASMFAQAAIVFKTIPSMTTYAAALQTSAENAWTWANANTGVKFFNAGVLAAGEQELSSDATAYTYSLMMRQIAAASFLYKLTAKAAYKTYFDGNYSKAHLIAWSYVYPFESTEQDVLLYYTKTTGATSAVVTAVKNAYTNSVISGNADNFPAYTNKTDAYRAYLSDNNYTWGSNSIKCKQGNILEAANVYNLSSANTANLNNATSGYLHYMHGVNPLAMVYLTNMNNLSAENSVNEFYNSWFDDGTVWDRVGSSAYGPPPGYVPGGANPSWSLDACCPTGCGSSVNNAKCVNQSPPSGQPIQKSFKDWNTGWPQNSWSVTENGIYYNASYIRLLSKFMKTGTCGVLTGFTDDLHVANIKY